MPQRYDTIVLGGGIVGAATAYALVNRGQRVLLIEQFEPGHKHGSSHGDGRVVRFNYGESIYVEMALLGYPAWERLSQAAGQPLIQKTGLLEYGPADCQPIQETEAQLHQHKLAYEKLSAAQAGERFPQFRFAGDTTILYQPDGAVALATPAVLTLWRLFRERGGSAVTGRRIDRIQVDADSVTLHDTQGANYSAAKLVIAAGSWAKQLLQPLGLDLPLVVTQEVLAYFPPKDERVNHRVGTMPVMIDFHTTAPFYCLPIVDIGGVRVGWHHTGPVIQPDDERVIPAPILEGMKGWIERVFPHLDRQPVDIQTCLYTTTPDKHFVLDRHPKHSHVVIAAACSGHAFKFGPILGELLAGLVMEETLPLSLATFALSRFEDVLTQG